MVQRSAGSRGEGSVAETVRRETTPACFDSRLHRVDPVCLLRGGVGCQAYEVDLKQEPTFLRNVGRRYSGKLVDVPE